jgi:glutamyl-tRNA reductase
LRQKSAHQQDVLCLSATAGGGTTTTTAMVYETIEVTPEMLLIDLAVPRDIDSDVADIPGAHLCTVDDLQGVISATLSRRNGSLAAARQIVEQEWDEFYAWLRSQNTLPVLSSWRQHAEEVRDAEVQRAMRRLNDLSPEQQYVVEALSRSIVNKLLHDPTLRTKQAAACGDGQRYADMIRDLWGL